MVEISKTGYFSDEIKRNIGNKTIKVENLTPNSTKLEEHKKRISQELFEIFSKYPTIKG